MYFDTPRTLTMNNTRFRVTSFKILRKMLSAFRKLSICLTQLVNLSWTYFQVNGVSEETDNLKTETVSSEIKDEKAVSQGEEAS